MMNVLYVTQHFSFSPTHAAAVTTYEIIKRLAEKGHKATMLAPYIEGHQPTSQVSVVPAFSKNVKVIVSTRAPLDEAQENLLLYGLICSFGYVPLILKALRKRTNYDVIISMYHPSHLATPAAYIISRLLKIPFIVKVHDLLPDVTDPNVWKRIYKKVIFKINSVFFKKANLLLVPSTEWIDLAMKVYGVSKNKLVLFPNGVDTTKFNPNIECSSLGKALGLEKRKTLVFVGKILRERGLECLIKALPNIVKKEPDLRLLIIGGGPGKTELFNLSKRFGVDEFLIFVNEVDHDSIPKYISLADIAIGPLAMLPITVGTFPIKVLEYMACGKPVVACFGGFSRDLVSKDHDCLLVHPEDVDELSSAILKLLREEDFAETLGVNARKHIERFYDWDVIINTLEEVLNNISR